MEKELGKLLSVTSWFIALQITTLFAFLGCAALVYIEVQQLQQLIATQPATASTSEITRKVDDWERYIHAHNASTSNVAKEITVIEFTDFQCPYCRAFNNTTRAALLSKYGDSIRLVFKHFPLEAIHTEARSASIAAQCALREGKFWEIKDTFFNNSELLSEDYYIEQGASLQLGDSYSVCVRDAETEAEVEADIQDGLSLGIQGTPTFLINGTMLNGAMPLHVFEEVIDSLRE